MNMHEFFYSITVRLIAAILVSAALWAVANL